MNRKMTDEECVFKILNGFYAGRLKSFNGTTRWWSGREWEYMEKRYLIKFITESLPKRYRDKPRINRIYELFLHRMPRIDS